MNAESSEVLDEDDGMRGWRHHGDVAVEIAVAVGGERLDSACFCGSGIRQLVRRRIHLGRIDGIIERRVAGGPGIARRAARGDAAGFVSGYGAIGALQGTGAGDRLD